VNGTATQLLAMEAPLRRRRVKLHLLEPAGVSKDALWQRLFDGTYDKPFIIDRGMLRFLHFDLLAVQSAMNLRHPDRLSLAYTRKMMSFLIFNQAPARILLLGLGGGSLAKFCYRHLPGATVTAVESNPDVIALRNAFCIPADDERFRVICADGASYVECLARSKDVILADACDRSGVAPQLDPIEFYEHAHRCLSNRGVFVANLCGDSDRSCVHLSKIRAVFGSGVVTLPVRQDGNVIVLAFKERWREFDWESLAATAIRLKRRFRLDFPEHLRRIALEWQLRRLQCGCA
jgi:spermidine synthase